MENKTFQTAPNYVHRKIVDSDVLISVGENIANFNGYIELNPSASLLWDAMGTAKSFDELCAVLTEEYELTNEQAATDVQEFIELLQEHNMVVVQ